MGYEVKGIENMWVLNGLEAEMERESVGMQLGGSDVHDIPEAT